MTEIGLVGFLGAGQMASAIAGGMVQQGHDPKKINARDIVPSALKRFAEVSGAKGVLSEDAAATLKDAQIVVLAIKPQLAAASVRDVADLVRDKLIISIMAGVPIVTVREWVPRAERVARVMPNICALVGESTSAYAVTGGVSAADKAAVEAIFGACGMVREVSEKQLDTITGLCGSGPAFVFEFIQAMAFGGVWSGLSWDVATSLATQTVLGAAKMLEKTGKHPAELRDMVTSPAGTTAAGLAVLDRTAFRSAVSEAVKAAVEQSRNLGKKA